MSAPDKPYEDCPECGGVVLTRQTIDDETARMFEYKGCISCRWVGETIELDSSTGKPIPTDDEPKLEYPYDEEETWYC